jgi:hypothetical protein
MHTALPPENDAAVWVAVHVHMQQVMLLTVLSDRGKCKSVCVCAAAFIMGSLAKGCLRQSDIIIVDDGDCVETSRRNHQATHVTV